MLRFNPSLPWKYQHNIVDGVLSVSTSFECVPVQDGNFASVDVFDVLSSHGIAYFVCLPYFLAWRRVFVFIIDDMLCGKTVLGLRCYCYHKKKACTLSGTGCLLLPF